MTDLFHLPHYHWCQDVDSINHGCHPIEAAFVVRMESKDATMEQKEAWAYEHHNFTAFRRKYLRNYSSNQPRPSERSIAADPRQTERIKYNRWVIEAFLLFIGTNTNSLDTNIHQQSGCFDMK